MSKVPEAATFKYDMNHICGIIHAHLSTTSIEVSENYILV